MEILVIATFVAIGIMLTSFIIGIIIQEIEYKKMLIENEKSFEKAIDKFYK